VALSLTSWAHARLEKVIWLYVDRINFEFIEIPDTALDSIGQCGDIISPIYEDQQEECD